MSGNQETLIFNPHQGGDEEENLDADFDFDSLEVDDPNAPEPEAEPEKEVEAEAEPEAEAEAEPEAEAEAEPEAEAEAEPELEVTDKDKLVNPDENPLVPRERLKAATRRTREETERANNALQRVAELEAQMKVEAAKAGVTNISPDKMKEAAEKMLDGDSEPFSNLLAESMNGFMEQVTTNNQALQEQATQQAVAIIRQEAADAQRRDAAAHWETVYPQLDPNSDKLNEDALVEAGELLGVYEARGDTPDVAMRKAVKAVAAMYDLESTEKPAAAPEAAPEPKRRAAPPVKAPQPAVTGKGGEGSNPVPEINPETLSQEEWEALPKSTRDKILTE